MARGRKDPSSPAPSESELCGEFNFSSSYESSILRTAEIEFNDWNALRQVSPAAIPIMAVLAHSNPLFILGRCNMASLDGPHSENRG
jgi:hypothetical protein